METVEVIYRQDALEALRTCYETERIDYTNGNEYINYEQAVHEVEQLPSAQSERKTGVWLDDKDNPESVKTDGYCAYCSVCKEWSEYLTAYCGNCGADMRGKQDERFNKQTRGD